MRHTVTTVYKFTPLKKRSLPRLKREIVAKAKLLKLEGLLLLAEEGVNATVSGSSESISQFKAHLEQMFGAFKFKDSTATRRPFRRFKVSIRQEIVQLKRPDIQPGEQSHLSPAEWDKLMANKEAVLIDVRNWYETRLGTFRNAIDPNTWAFSQFPEWVKTSGISKDATIGIFCTGGVRCEKAAVAMEEQGYTNVHQLDGGILNYLEQRPGKNYEGECFVFDHRAAVQQDLTASEAYSVCPHCGNPGNVDAVCVQCDRACRMCSDCQGALRFASCSKRCRNEYITIQERSAAQKL